MSRKFKIRKFNEPINYCSQKVNESYIVNTDINICLQVSKLPFPYSSVDQFEKSLRAPLGKDWNTETAFRQLVKPKVVTKIGSVIEPINKEETLRNQNKQKSAKRKADMAFGDKISKSKHSKRKSRN